MLEKNHSEIPLRTQADLLGISYSSLFHEPVPPSSQELAIKRCIDELYAACPFYGSRKIAFLLRPEFGVSRPTVQVYTLAPPARAGVREIGILPWFQVHIRVNLLRNTRFTRTCCELRQQCAPITSGGIDIT